MKFKVIGLSIQDEKAGEVRLQGKHPDTFYNSLLFLKVPLSELSFYKFADEFELVPVPHD